MKTFKLRWIVPAFFTFSLLAACDGSTPPGEEPPPPEEMVQVAEAESFSKIIGSEGGTLEAPADSMLHGVRLVVPAGALNAPVEISIKETIDSTPLPELAFRVGQHVTIEPASMELAMPATLTLPFDRDLVERFGQLPSDVKVWVRENEGWSLRQAIETSSTTVTIELAQPAIAAAGVSLSAVSLSCGPSCVSPLPRTAERCTDPSGYCLESFGVLNPPPDLTTSFEVSDSSFYYLSNGTNTVSLVRRDFLNGGPVTSFPVINPGATRANFEVDSDGSAWLGLGSRGNVHFTGFVPQLHDTTGGLGAVLVAGTTLVRFTAEGLVARLNGTFSAPFSLTTSGQDPYNPALADNPNLILIAEKDPNGNGFFQYAIGSVLGRVVIGTRVRTELSLDPRHDRGAIKSIAPMRNHDVAVLFGQRSVPAAVIVVHDGHNTTRLQDSSYPPFDIAADRSSNVWITISNQPLILEARPDGGGQGIALTQAAVDTPEYRSHLPLWVRTLSNGTVLIMTVGGEMLRLVPAN